MHSYKPLLLIGIGAAAAVADSVCSPLTTVFVTVSASPVTETVLALNTASAATVGVDTLVSGGTEVASTANTITVPAPVVSTRVISVIQVSSSAEDQAAYSFTEDNGTTTWFGATPPTSGSLATSTQVVTLQPVPPGYVAPLTAITPVTSYLTYSSTETVTEAHTGTRTLTSSTACASVGAYTGLAPNGWNSSISTFITVISPAIGSGTAYPRVTSGVVPFPPRDVTRHLEARDIPDIVVATIDGMAVSWTNNYDGTPPSTSDASPNVVPLTATTLQIVQPNSSLISSTVSRPVQTGVVESSLPPVSAAGVTLSPTSSSSSAISSTSTASSSTTTDTAYSCDASADFVITFDDLPTFSAGPGDTDIPPIFSPYHHLYFQEYFGYVPPPSDPFPPISPPQLAVYRADGSAATGSLSAGDEMTGEIGAGPRASESAFWIDAFSAYLGCDNAGPDDCSIMVKGYQNSSFFSFITQGFTLPPCAEMTNCSLTLVEFADGFRNLTGLQIIATVGTTAVDWYMDNLSLGWSNNTCAAQLERSSEE